MIPRIRPNFGIGTVLSALRHGRGQGSLSRGVEAEVAAKLGLKHVIAMPSGRGSLFVLLRCLPPGRVCIPGYTCSAVAEAATLAGREVSFLEHRSDQLNLTSSDLVDRLCHGDIFILTHQYGYATGVSDIVAQARQQGAIVVEDIAAAFAGTSSGKPLGSFGLASFGSFDVSKLVHVPLKGGFIATDDDLLAERIRAHAASLHRTMTRLRMLRLAIAGTALCLLTKSPLYKLFHWLNFERKGRFTAEDGALATSPNSYYLDQFAEWQAAIALPQLRNLNRIIEDRAKVEARLRTHCHSHPLFSIEAPAPEVPGAAVRFPIYANGDKLALYETFASRGVDCGFSFTTLATPIIQLQVWRIARSVLNLPFYPTLTSREIDRLIRTLDETGRKLDAD